jgi:transcriptional regulator with XRE-family HTH domain
MMIGNGREIEMFAPRRLTQHRKRAGLTQRQLAIKSGIRQNTISAIECGVQEPRLSTLVELAKALEVSVSVFFDEFDERAC